MIIFCVHNILITVAKDSKAVNPAKIICSVETKIATRFSTLIADTQPPFLP
jgi:hypothetical protein